MPVLTEVFLSFVVTSVIGCFLAVARMFYKSKCQSVSCCGLHVIRDIEAEEKLDEIIERPVTERKTEI